MIIGIPKYKDDASFQVMLKSLQKSTTAYDEIVVIESFDEEPTIEETIVGNITTIHTTKEGPLKAYERLFNIAKEKKQDLFLTQTDVLFFKCYERDWLEEMKELAKNKDCGMITCLNGGGESGPEFIDGYYWIGAWCTYIPYRAIEKIGGYDMNIPLGWGVDIDYTYAIQKVGLNIYQTNYWVDHHPNYVEGHDHERVDNIEELKKDAFAYMRKKWELK